MGYLPPILIDELTLPSDPKWKVQMKRVGTYGDRLAGQSEMLKLSLEDDSVTKAEMKGFVLGVTASMVLSWNLTDANDKPLPVSIESIAAMPEDDGKFLAKEALDRLKVREEKAQDAFSDASGSQSTPPRGTPSQSPESTSSS